MVPHSIKLFILEFAHHLWHLYNRIIFLITTIYYYLLSNIEQNETLIRANLRHIGDNSSSCNHNHLTTANGNGSKINQNYDAPIQKDLRRPKHIAMAFTNESNYLNLDSIAKLLCWCKQLGISDITLYDELGRLKQREEELYSFFERRMSLLGYEKPISYIKGLKIVSKLDGRRKFVEDIRDLLGDDPELINIDQVQNHAGWTTDPDMLINFGSPLCLRGFPPWQLRLTEIFSIPTHRNIPERIFIDCLYKFSRTTQRVGA